MFVAAAALVCGWWLIDNQVRYGDPLASEETRATLKAIAPIPFSTDPPLQQAFITVPSSLWKSWWYQSGYNQFFWDWWLFLPFWLGLAVAGVLVTLWVVGIGTTTMQGRLGFYGLAAVAILFARRRARPGAGVGTLRPARARLACDQARDP